MATDTKLRHYLGGLAVAIAMSAGGCAAKDFYSRLDAAEQDIHQGKVKDAVVEQEIKDFRESFEEFKKDVKDDIARHHR